MIADVMDRTILGSVRCHLDMKLRRKILQPVDEGTKPAVFYTDYIMKKRYQDLWAVKKARLKSLFPKLKDEDFEYENGKKDVMLEDLQIKVGKSSEELIEILFNESI